MPKSPRRSRSRIEAVKLGFRSDFEKRVAEWLDGLNIYWEYEPHSISYTPPTRKYKPDFVLENGIIIEAKGRFTGADRVKHLLIKKQHPELDIRFVFQYDNKLSTKSKVRYSEWCEANGFKYAIREVPPEWAEE